MANGDLLCLLLLLLHLSELLLEVFDITIQPAELLAEWLSLYCVLSPRGVRSGEGARAEQRPNGEGPLLPLPVPTRPCPSN